VSVLQCSKNEYRQLKNHIRNVLTKDDVKLKCYFCHVSFPNNMIREHLAKHTQEKAFKCGYCIVSCTKIGNLMSHIAPKHSKTDQGRKIRNKLRRNYYFCNKSVVPEKTHGLSYIGITPRGSKITRGVSSYCCHCVFYCIIRRHEVVRIIFCYLFKVIIR